MSKFVREVDSIDELRNTPTSDAAAAHVRTPTEQSGIFVPMDGDPFGNGDDGATALQATDGTWWVRKAATDNARVRWFGSDEQAVTDAISFAASQAYEECHIGETLLPYDPSSVTFDTSVRMVRDGNQDDVIDVTAYGARDDASFDNLPAFTAAEAFASPGQTIWVPNAHYGLSQRFQIGTDDVTLEFESWNARLSVFDTNGGPTIRVIDQNGVTIKNGRVSGTPTAGTGEDGVSALVLRGDGNANKAENCTIQNMLIDEGRDNNLRLSGIKDCTIVGNTLENANPNGNATNGGNDIKAATDKGDIIGNRILNNECLTNNEVANHIALLASSSGDKVNQNTIKNNDCRNGTNSGNPGHGIAIYDNGGGVLEHNKIVLNYVENVPNMGIYLQAGSGDEIKYTTVALNHIKDPIQSGSGGTLLDGGISSNGGEHFSIIGNLVRQPGGTTPNSHGIIVDGVGHVISNNVVRDGFDDKGYQIMSDQTIVSNNECRNTGKEAFLIVGSNVVLTANRSRDCASWPLVLSSNGTVVNGHTTINDGDGYAKVSGNDVDINNLQADGTPDNWLLNGDRTRYNGIIGGGILPAVDISTVTGASVGDRARTSGASAAPKGVIAVFAGTDWIYPDSVGTITP